MYLFDLESGKQERLGDFPNMTFSPRFSPDGNRVALTLENGGLVDADLGAGLIERIPGDVECVF